MGFPGPEPTSTWGAPTSTNGGRGGSLPKARGLVSLAVVPRSLDLLELTAQPDAVSEARRWLRARLADWSEVGVEAAQLVASELVTNVILHGRGPIQVALERRAHQALIEVLDRSGAAPVLTRYGQRATTGRGLLLVDGIARGWGVRRFPNGKGVWAVIADELVTDQPAAPAGASGSERGQAPPTWDPPGDLTATAAPTPGPLAGSHPSVTVRIVDLPLAIYLAAQQHNDALMREFHWLIDRGARDGVPSRLVQLASEAHARFGAETAAIRAQVAAAVAAGRDRFDLKVDLPRAARPIVTELAELLDEADAYCQSGDLLTLASPPDLRRFRTWYLDQVLGQLAGRPPSPWPAEWDLAPSNPVGVAPSDPLARECGA